MGQDSSPHFPEATEKSVSEVTLFVTVLILKTHKMLIITGSSGKGALNSLLETSNPNYFLRNKPQRLSTN